MTRIMVVGVGSPHGDDRAGWDVIEQLQGLQLKDFSLRKAAVPHDLLDWIAGVDALHIIDSCTSETRPVNLQRFELQAAQADSDGGSKWIPSRQCSSGVVVSVEPNLTLRSAGSHRIDVMTVLDLAHCLNQLPRSVILWAIPGQRFRPGESISESCKQSIQGCVEEITKELTT